jgi:NADH-quinone oxidoreductase subunit N
MNWIVALPELLLTGGAMGLLMVGVFLKQDRARLISWLAVLVIVIAMIVVIQNPAGGGLAFGNLFIVDRFSQFMKLLTLGASALSILLSLDYIEREYMARFEFPVLILFATSGMLMMISANDLISLYLGLEFQSLALYVVAAFQRDSLRSTEAGLKYFVPGARRECCSTRSMICFAGTTGFVGLAVH